jgi:hypothetical protein
VLIFVSDNSESQQSRTSDAPSRIQDLRRTKAKRPAHRITSFQNTEISGKTSFTMPTMWLSDMQSKRSEQDSSWSAIADTV